MDTPTGPLVVMQTNAHGRGVVVGLAFERNPAGQAAAAAQLANQSISTARIARDKNAIERDSTEESRTETTSRTSTVWADLRTRMRRSRRSTIHPRLACFPRSMTIERLVPHLSVDESPKTQEYAAKRLAEISAADEFQSTIANSSQAMAGLTRLLFVGNPCSYFAAVALANLASVEDNLHIFKEFPEALTGLVTLLFRFDDPLAQQESAMALANLSRWPEGGKMILDTPQSIKGLVGLAILSQLDKYCGQDEANKALLNLALLRDNRSILDYPMSLAALAGCLTIYGQEDRSTGCSVDLLEGAIKALASLSYTKENALKILKSDQFPQFLEVLVRFLQPNSISPMGESMDRLKVRKMAAMALANLSITEGTQLMVANFPNALTGLFASFRPLLDGERAVSMQVQECSAMALGNLALTKENRAKIVDFCGADGLAGLASVLFEDDNPGGQEYAAWALANLSHDPHDIEYTAIKIAASPNIVKGLARLLQLPTRTSTGSPSRLGAQEQAVRALANLTYPHANQAKIARVPNVVKALAAALLSRRCDHRLSPSTQEHAARALANLTCAKENWRSAELFGDALRSIVDVVSSDNVEASHKTRKYGTLALGNFALEPSHHRAIVESKEAMTGLVSMIYRLDAPVVGREQAAWTLANLAHGDFATKSAIASFPFAIIGLLGLLSIQECSSVQDQARRALAGLQDVVLDSYVSWISRVGASCDPAGSTSNRPFSSFEMSSRAEACI